MECLRTRLSTCVWSIVDTSLVWCYDLLILYQVFGNKIVDVCLVWCCRTLMLHEMLGCKNAGLPLMCWCVFQMLITPIYNPAQGQPLAASPSIHRQVATESPFFFLPTSLSLRSVHAHTHTCTHVCTHTHACTHALTHSLTRTHAHTNTHSWGCGVFLCVWLVGFRGVMLKIRFVCMTINPVAFHYFPFGLTHGPDKTFLKKCFPIVILCCVVPSGISLHRQMCGSLDCDESVRSQQCCLTVRQ